MVPNGLKSHEIPTIVDDLGPVVAGGGRADVWDYTKAHEIPVSLGLHQILCDLCSLGPKQCIARLAFAVVRAPE